MMTNSAQFRHYDGKRVHSKRQVYSDAEYVCMFMFTRLDRNNLHTSYCGKLY